MKELEIEDKTEPESMIQIGPRIPKSLNKELKILAAREDRDIQDIVVEVLSQYVKIHGSGNPIYALDKFADPDFKVTPAFGEKIQSKWKPFLRKCEKKELDEFYDQAEAIKKAINEIFRFGEYKHAF